MFQRAHAPTPQRTEGTPAPSSAAPVRSPSTGGPKPFEPAALAERATRLGHHFGRVHVSPPVPAAAHGLPIQRADKRKRSGSDPERDSEERVEAVRKRARRHLDREQSYVVTPRGVARVDPATQVRGYMEGSLRAAERMALTPTGPVLDKGYVQTPFSTRRDVLSAGAAHTRAPSGLAKQQLVDAGGQPLAKIYPSIFGHRRPPDVRNPGGQRPFSNLTSGPSSARGTDYSRSDAENIYGTAHYRSQTPEFTARRAAVSVSEMNRGMGAGAGQLLAETTQVSQGLSRSDAYGTGKEPGLIPASYKGSEKDIMSLEASSMRDAEVMHNPIAHQLDFVLNAERRQSRPPLTRSLSSPDLSLGPRQQRQETERALLATGFSPEDVRRAGLRTPASHPSRSTPGRSFDNPSETLARSGSLGDLNPLLRDKEFRG